MAACGRHACDGPYGYVCYAERESARHATEVETPGYLQASLRNAHVLAAYRVLMNATRSAFSWSVSSMLKRVS
jgi:hypothetical protein